MFQCDRCGICCRNLKKSNLYKDLDRGDGVCRYLENNLCTIYDTRPILCRIDESYKIYFEKIMNKEDYYKLNYEACKILKRNKEK